MTMDDKSNSTSQEAWIAVDQGLEHDSCLVNKGIRLKGRHSALHEGAWVLILNSAGGIVRIGRVLRIRVDAAGTSLYFDKAKTIEPAVGIGSTNLLPPKTGCVIRAPWTEFAEAIPRALGITLAEIPLIENEAYVRELLQYAIMDDLLGPAGGPEELIVDMSVRDRYLVGKLAPMENAERGEDIAPPETNEEDEPTDLEPKAQSNKVDSPQKSGGGDSEAEEEVDTASNQSLAPSSLGFTFCVDGNVERLEVVVSWGRYERVDSDDSAHAKVVKKAVRDAEGRVIKTIEQVLKAKVWRRKPSGGIFPLALEDGVITPVAPDAACQKVLIQGTVRSPNEKGERLVTLFLVNGQTEPDENRDTAWVFQPEIRVRANDESSIKEVFRRRPALEANVGAADDDDLRERLALEMIYRDRVEFAVGHGVAVHALCGADVARAVELRTVVMPQYEVPVTETPGLDSQDRPAMRRLVDEELLDMKHLAELETDELVAALGILTEDYAAWIKNQRARIETDAVGYAQQADEALGQCESILIRLREGVSLLATDDKALAAFRFANRAMAIQRVHSAFALQRRRGRTVKLEEFDISKNRSWRPFQLAFLLLSLPGLADPKHTDRTQPLQAYADLLWFPTGGGKTEAYLGVAAFTMAIRRLQGNMGGYDASRGLAVIMRYTLRLLTLQQFQRATALLCAMEHIRREALAAGDKSLGDSAFTIGLWVGNKVTPGSTEDSHKFIEAIRTPGRNPTGMASPAQLTGCPWCGTEIDPSRDIEVDKIVGRTTIYCGDKLSVCDFSRGRSSKLAHPGLPVMVVDEEMYHRPPSMMIATVDKFAMMAWRGQVRNLFGRVSKECSRHGLLWPGSECNTGHRAVAGRAAASVKAIAPVRPPDLIIQDEFHLISGPLGTMVGLYESTVDELCTWQLGDDSIRPKVIASTATVRKAQQQVNNVFMRQVSVFPPHGLDVEDNFFSVQRPIEQKPGRRYLGICSPGSSRPAMLIRVYTAALTAAQALFDRFGKAADPYMTMVGYFNSLRELGGMKRLAEDDVQTRAYRVQMSMVQRPGLAQRSVMNIRELTSRVSNQDIPKYLDQLEVMFKSEWDPEKGKYVTRWEEGDSRAIDIVLATNMLSVGVDVNRLGIMAVNGQPKGTAEYIQATSRVGRQFPGLVCTVLTWARPRDLSHYETFEHYHATFYKHVEAQSVTPFSPRAMDRGLTGAMLSLIRAKSDDFAPNDGAQSLKQPDQAEMLDAMKVLETRADNIAEAPAKKLAGDMLKQRADQWVNEVMQGNRILAYEKRGPDKDRTVPLIKAPGAQAWDNWTVPMSMREVEPGVRLVMNSTKIKDDIQWKPRPAAADKDE
ncbi:DISARM system helicase DrmA [Pseudomonas sp. TMW22091]|uniref:DISARM system helicase DrmA n=1 Tax=Pseudomonas sp. TMW22091 TaxID=2506435 RepID=UPI001F0D043B|nr:DISARM system helicase DrmA [Pseudomonas sp. TMW22091]MCH4874752.1 helicase [Pseudomonas sp. TMW22091]